MGTSGEEADGSDDSPAVGPPKGSSAGVAGVLSSLRYAGRAGLLRTLPGLFRVNQPEGFDCLGRQGRLSEPMHLSPGDSHYRPISWDAAFDLIASRLIGLDSPDEAVFYTSGRAQRGIGARFGRRRPTRRQSRGGTSRPTTT